MLPKLFKRTKTGAIQEWQIITENDTFYTIEGQVDGKLTQSKPTVCKAKNTGRANATTPEEQAEKQALAKWTKQTEKGYTDDISKVDEVERHYEPMLARDYKKTTIGFPAMCQPKLDGVRAIITKNGAFTRNGKKHCCIPHVLEELKPFFERFPDAVCDGELYNHEYKENFNKLVSLVKKTKPTADDLEESRDKVQFHCYDLPRVDVWTESDAFIDRWSSAQVNLCDLKYVRLVETVTVDCKDSVDTLLSAFVSVGYEGVMVRNPTAAYENKRSKHLLKYKEFQDAEYEIISVHEGEGNKTGMAGYFVCALPQGGTFKSNIKGPHEYLTKLWHDKDSLVGKTATVKFFNLTPDGVPRFPYTINIDRNSYE
jgi:DNA ligase-1